MAEHRSPEDERRDEESLADAPLVPVRDDASARVGGLATGLILVGMGGLALFVVANALTPTLGATRSSKLKWEQRKAEIERAARDAQTESESIE